MVAEVQALVRQLASWPRRGGRPPAWTPPGWPWCSPSSSGGAASRLGRSDVYAATVGGVRLTDPAADLALALAVAGAAADRPLPTDAGGHRRDRAVRRRPAGHRRPAAAGRGGPAGLPPGPRAGRSRTGAGRRVAMVRGQRPADAHSTTLSRRREATAQTRSDLRSARRRVIDVSAVERDMARRERGGRPLAPRRPWRPWPPGTPLRDGLERILRGRTGALIVLGYDKTVESLCTGRLRARRRRSPPPGCASWPRWTARSSWTATPPGSCGRTCT